MNVVAWHEVECHGYDEDLPQWLDLAERVPGPVLDVGAGTGRVAVALAEAGHDVTALDLEPELLAAIPDPRVRTVCADAQDFHLEGFGLVIVPMQTLQLLSDRPAFFACARRALRSRGLLAAAIADELVEFEGEEVPLADGDFRDGHLYLSQPTAVRLDGARARIERIRTVDDGEGELNVIELAIVSPAQLAAEARAAGFTPLPGERIPATDEHVGSSVVVFRA